MRRETQKPKTYATLGQLQSDNKSLYYALFKEKNLSFENVFDIKLMELLLMAEGKIRNENKRLN